MIGRAAETKVAYKRDIVVVVVVVTDGDNDNESTINGSS